MIAALLLSVLPTPASSFVPAAAWLQEAGDADADAKIAAAGTDVAKLFELAKAFAGESKDDAAKKTYKKIVELDPKHEEAHKALRHHFYDGKWFESYAELSKYRREETTKMKEKGLARWRDQWVAEADVPYLNMGWTKDEATGKWSNPAEVARKAQIEQWKTEGYTFRPDDSTWFAPAEKAQVDAGLCKCGDQWLDLAKANEYHAQIGQWWKLEGEYFSVWTTCDWEGGSIARWHADRIYPDMVRLFGLTPEAGKKPHFVVLNGLDQYNQAAGGQPPLLPETEGFSSLHGAYFADAFFDPTAQPPAVPEYLGCGVSYWDRKDSKLAPWGPYWLRWAAAQSYVEAVDPSWLTISEQIAAAASGGAQPNPGAFWAEKKIPRWLRYGAASYAERYMKRPDVSDGGNPWELREFAFGELAKAGTLRKIEDIFAFPLDLNDLEGSSRLYHEAGLVVSYLLDGADGDKKLREKHAAFKAALKSDDKDKAKKLAEAVEGLQKELAKNEKDIKKFAGM
jgi:hypothetical protein